MPLSQRDRRTLVLTAIIAGTILLYHFVLDAWFCRWGEVKRSLRREIRRLQTIDLRSDAVKARFMALQQQVPAVEMPVEEDLQRFLFQEKLNQQLKSLGIKPERFTYVGSTAAGSRGRFRLIKLQTRAGCPLAKAFELLAVLPENPYLVGIEEFYLKVDPKNRKKAKLVLTVSTLALRG
jgi:hypothetical protein